MNVERYQGQVIVSVDEVDIHDFCNQWPACNLRDLEGVTFTFDAKNADLIDIEYGNGDSEQWDGPAILALSQGAQDHAGLAANPPRPGHEPNAGEGDRERFAEGFRTGERDRTHHRTRPLCTSRRSKDYAPGVLNPVVKANDHSFYHGYKAATEGAGPEAGAWVQYQAKHRRLAGTMAANRQHMSNDRHDQLVDVMRDTPSEELRKQYAAAARSMQKWSEPKMARPPKHLFDDAQDTMFAAEQVLKERGEMSKNAHLSLDGNFSFGVGDEPKHRANAARAGDAERQARRWMEARASEFEDPKTGEVNATLLAETAANEVGHNEWLDDSLHPLWDWALKAAEGHQLARYGYVGNARQGQFKEPASLTESERFFFEHAGQSYPTGASPAERKRLHIEQAKALAEAEAEAARRGWTFEWEHDQDADTSWMDAEALADFESGRTELLSVLLRDENGDVLESLGGVHLSARGHRDPYGRLVEAELAQNALAAAESSGREMALNGIRPTPMGRESSQDHLTATDLRGMRVGDEITVPAPRGGELLMVKRMRRDEYFVRLHNDPYPRGGTAAEMAAYIERFLGAMP